jgi:hypothetical protein
MNARRWPHIPPGATINLPQGTEFMRSGLGNWTYYNPILNKSFYITGSTMTGYDVIEYDQPLCPLCWERYRRYREIGA